MEHISQNIAGFCNFQSFYREIVKWMPDGGTFVEVGAYWGQSFSYAVVEGINSGKKIDFVAVDAWPDAWPSPEGWPMIEKFKHEMAPLEGHYRMIQSGSAAAAEKFADRSVDFVFIDADHKHERVKDDISAWLPKIRPGGIIAGHDYNHPHDGCVQAVNEAFGPAVIPIPSDDFHETERPFFSWKAQL